MNSRKDNARDLDDAPLKLQLLRALLRLLPRGRFPVMSMLAPRLGQKTPFIGGVSGIRFVVEDSVSRDLYLTGCHEHCFSALLHHLLRPGDTFVDVGANFGYFCLLARRIVTDKGRCIAFEPDPYNLKRFRRNLTLNGIKDVQIVECACSDAVGETTFYASQDEQNLGTGSTIPRETHGYRFVVSVCTLDSSLQAAAIDHVRLAKFDIEGGEIAAFKGFESFLSNKRVDCLLVECHESILQPRGLTVRPMLDQIAKNGYTVAVIDSARGAYSMTNFSGTARPISAFHELPHRFGIVAWLPERCAMPFQSHVMTQ